MAQASAIGIDAPMGWPSELVDLLPEYMATGRGSVVPQSTDGRVWYDELRLRETDRAVHRLLLAERDVSVRPLSVSSDTIAVVPWRCARLLAMHGERNGVAFDRTGEGSGVFEVYPAAALGSWGFPHKGAPDRGCPSGGRETPAGDPCRHRTRQPLVAEPRPCPGCPAEAHRVRPRPRRVRGRPGDLRCHTEVDDAAAP